MPRAEHDTSLIHYHCLYAPRVRVLYLSHCARLTEECRYGFGYGYGFKLGLYRSPTSLPLV